MARRTYTSTIQLKCAKEHACAACGNVYQYQMNRKVVGTSSRSADDASAKCRAAVDRTIKTEVDQQPCPACGLVQPDMVGQRRGKSHKLTLIVMSIVAIVVLGLRGADVLNAGAATWTLVAMSAAWALGYAATEGTDPNRDMDANRAKAADAIEAGTVRVAPDQKPIARPAGGDVPGRAKSWWPVIALVALAPIVAVAPEAVRRVKAWPVNDAFYPPVVGPGDSAKVYMSGKITSVKGYYRGSSSATLNVPPAAPVILSTTMNQNSWGNTISVKSSEKATTHRPWVAVSIPPTPDLAGKIGECAIHVAVEFPYIPAGESNFEIDQQEMNERFPVKLAPVGAGTLFNTIWWSAGAAAIGLLFVGGLALLAAAKRLRGRVTMTNVYQTA